MDTNTEEVKKVLKWVWVVLVVLAVFLAAETLGALKNLRSIDPTYNSISVSGVGEAVAIPDIATFSFTVSADAQAVNDAQEEVTEKMNAILGELEAMGIEKKDVKTTDYSVWPKYTFAPVICSPTFCPPSRQVPDGYSANHSVSIKIRNTEEAGQALALVGDNGATGLSNISFTVDDPDKILDEARAEAITDAREKAKLLSRELEVKLVRVVSFYDNTDGGPVSYYAQGFEGDAVRTRTQATSVPTIPTGENKVNVSVTIVYEIR